MRSGLVVRARSQFNSAEIPDFLRAHLVEEPAASRSRELMLSAVGTYEWQDRAPSRRAGGALIIESNKSAHRCSRRTCKSSRLLHHLADECQRLNRKGSARPSREEGSQGLGRRRPIRTVLRHRPRCCASPSAEARSSIAVPKSRSVRDLKFVVWRE